MEFLCHYGPAFNMSDVIPDPLTYSMCVCVMSIIKLLELFQLS